jgi:YgiT-type zinc finger domain-containing protein
MKCAICKNGNTHPGQTSVFLQRGNAMVIIKEVPADICDNCGEYYLDDTVTSETLRYAEDALQKGTEIGIVRYAA